MRSQGSKNVDINDNKHSTTADNDIYRDSARIWKVNLKSFESTGQYQKNLHSAHTEYLCVSSDLSSKLNAY